ncbi:MAG: invasion associated locus B family protein, partial [Roseovarius gahaiensis]
DAFKAGVEANLQLVPAQAPDQTLNIKASLSGFTAAFDNVSIVEN